VKDGDRYAAELLLHRSMTVWVAPVLLASAGLLAPLPWVCRRPGDVSGPV